MRPGAPSEVHIFSTTLIAVRTRTHVATGCVTCHDDQRRRRSQIDQREHLVAFGSSRGGIPAKRHRVICDGLSSIPRWSARALKKGKSRLKRSDTNGQQTARIACFTNAVETFSEDGLVMIDLQSYVGLSSRELNSALKRLGSGANWHAAFHVFDHLCLERNNLKRSSGSFKPGDELSPPNSHVATTVLSIAGKHGDLDRVRSIFAWMQAQDQDRSAPTAWTYTAYIQAVGADGNWREAFDLYRDMRSSGLAPTSHTYSALIRAGARGGRTGAAAGVALVTDMRKDGIKPDIPIASALICAYGVLGQFSNAERILRAFGVESTPSTHRLQAIALSAGSDVKSGTEINSTLRFPITPRESETAQRGQSATKPDVKLYTEFIVAACRCGRPAIAAGLFESSGFPKTSYTCTAAIKAYGELLEWERAENIYVMMCQGDSSTVPNGITCSALLSAYEKCGQWQRALFFLSQLKTADPRHNGSAEHFRYPVVEEIHYNIVMSACGKCGKWSHADDLFKEMLMEGLVPSAVTYSTLIAAYGYGGEQDRAETKFKEMLRRGLKPDDYTFVGLMVAPASRGDFASCLDIKERMGALNVTPTVHIYNELIRAADISKNYELALQIYQMMVNNGIQPNATTRNLVHGVGKKGVEFYEDQQTAANFASLVAGLVGVAGMMAGRW